MEYILSLDSGISDIHSFLILQLKATENFYRKNDRQKRINLIRMAENLHKSVKLITSL